MPDPKPNAAEQILEDFRKAQPHYAELGRKLHEILDSLCKRSGLQIHAIVHRVKDEESLKGKLSRPNKAYGSLEELTDLVGLRVITYFEPDVDLVSEIIKAEFAIDLPNSVDKGGLLDPDRFGYRSVHFIVSLDHARGGLRENRDCAGLKAEIQVRSLLQHVWAEIEHDLKYKSKEAVPKHLQRKFAQLAGLLEMADDQFSHIREVRLKYSDEVAHQIEAREGEVEVNYDSLLALFNTEQLRRLETTLAQAAGNHYLNTIFDFNVAPTVEMLQHVGLTTIEAVQKAMTELGPVLEKYAIDRLKSEPSFVSIGFSLMALAQISVLREDDQQAALDAFVQRFGFGPQVDGWKDSFGRAL